MWQAFAEDSKPQQPPSVDSSSKSVRTRNGSQSKQASSFDSWGFGAESFTAVPAGSLQPSRPISEVNNSQNIGEAKFMDPKSASQPAGWAGF